MSEPELISPLLDGFVMGDPISAHDGVRCCPAMHQESGKKYIVKVISIPASQVQLEALLLTGAYSSQADALAYFRELSNHTVQEAELLQKLSRMEGYISYEGWQTVPMEDGVGYDIYLLGAYRPTLAGKFRTTPLTHLSAVNLGIDLCAALSVCRRSGYLYVDLKPENIYITENQEYRIGDIGFLAMDSLPYVSLPEKYRSAYTAPEIADAYSALNTSLDIYALGLVLYQIYNNGQLPTMGEPLVPPAYADYEMAEIILKACAEDPESRWADPTQMGQALVSYMQRNSINDIPIIPPRIPEEPISNEPVSEEPVLCETEETGPEEEAENTDSLPEVSREEPQTSAPEETLEPSEASEVQEASEAPEQPGAENPEQPEVDPPADIPEMQEEISAPEEDEDGQFMLDGFLTDETVPSEEDAAELTDAQVSEEVSAMLAQADALIAHQAPEPAIAPEPIEVPIPPLPQPDPEGAEPAEEAAQVVSGEEPPQEMIPVAAEETVSEEIQPEESTAPLPRKKSKTSRKKLVSVIVTLVSVLLILVLAAGAYLFYEMYYLQSVTDITLEGEGTSLTVRLDTQIDNELLTVVCTDTYGNTLHSPVSDNSAQFTGLNSGTSYRITVQISGFHRLIGTTAAAYTTSAQTNIVSFTAVTGESDGSVILNFSVQGPDNTAWMVKYSAPGTEEKTAYCTGHMATINDLKVGSTYTFQLEPSTDLYVVGNDILEYTASNVIYAENLEIQGFYSGALSVVWAAQDTVESWTVRCYNSSYDSTITVTEPSAVFENLDTASGYTVDVKAAGMSVSRQVTVSANSVTFKEILLDDSTPGQLIVTWNYEGTAPADGWRLLYTMDGSQKQVIQCEKNTCTITPLVPGCEYSISFELPDGITVFNDSVTYTVPETTDFSGYEVSAADMTFHMCRTPENPDWDWKDIAEEDYTDTFTLGEKASFVVRLHREYITSQDEISTLYVIRDENGTPVSATAGRARAWIDMWYKGYCELDVPVMPQSAGSYTVDIYFAGLYVTTQTFTVS